MKSKSLFIVIILLFIVSYNAHGEIPSDVSYEIIKIERVGSIKCSLDVRINKKIDKNTLTEIAHELRNRENKKYDKIFICYYLPGMKIGSGAWATTHFNPDLKVEVIGLSIEDEEKLKPDTEKDDKSIVGIWMDEIPYASSRITIKKDNSKIIMHRAYQDGSEGTDVLEESTYNGLRRFEDAGGNSFGEYYLIDESGKLGIYGRQGLIRNCRSIK